jgi:phage tail-like protein
MAEPGKPAELSRNYRFRIEMGLTGAQAHFTQCSGLGMRIQTIEYREAGADPDVRKLPGQTQYSDVELTYGVTIPPSRELWDWMLKSVSGTHETKNVSIIFLDALGVTEVRRVDLINAWICEYIAAPLDALGNTVVIERIRLTYERIDLPA